MGSWWKTWDEINRDMSGKTVIFYGRSEDWIPKTLPKIHIKPAYIVDFYFLVAGSSQFYICFLKITVSQ